MKKGPVRLFPPMTCYHRSSLSPPEARLSAKPSAEKGLDALVVVVVTVEKRVFAEDLPERTSSVIGEVREQNAACH